LKKALHTLSSDKGRRALLTRYHPHLLTTLSILMKEGNDF